MVCDQCSAYLRFVQIIVFEQPDVGGLNAQLLISSIKAREDQQTTSAMFHYVQSFLNICNMGEFKIILKLFQDNFSYILEFIR